jgi:hypothetical protein
MAGRTSRVALHRWVIRRYLSGLFEKKAASELNLDTSTIDMCPIGTVSLGHCLAFPSESGVALYKS